MNRVLRKGEVSGNQLFYESDSRDNLEENLVKGNFLENWIASCPQTMTFYLSRDHMFVQACLDGSNVLGPLTNTGWNIYHECHKEQKQEVASSGLRTDLIVPVDRVHPESLLKTIPLKNVIPCILHWITRTVEKLLTLEIENIVSFTNKITEKSHDMSLEDLVGNLEANVNKRGIRHGSFRVLFQKTGQPEKVSLNKDHALAIISPPPLGKETEFPHVLTNVVPHSKMVNSLPVHIRKYLHLEGDITEFSCVSMLWMDGKTINVPTKKNQHEQPVTFESRNVSPRSSR